MICSLCPYHCSLNEGQIGFCRGRKNIGGKIISLNYGMITSLALDPIEKKPLKRFYPGSMILSVGSFGCNLACPFCQNAEISQAGNEIEKTYISPEDLIILAEKYIPQGNIGVAFTYNEPLISYEYLMDCCSLAKKKNLKTVIVTNGTICQEPLKALLPYVDAMNIDLKGFTERFYKMIHGDLQTVKDAIRISNELCHVEVTCLVIPGENDSKEEMEEMSAWLALLSPDLPLHISRFFPRYKMLDKEPTPIKTIYRLAEIARKHLKYVYTGSC